MYRLTKEESRRAYHNINIQYGQRFKDVLMYGADGYLVNLGRQKEQQEAQTQTLFNQVVLNAVIQRTLMGTAQGLESRVLKVA